MVDRGTSENKHMKILDDAKVFNKTFDVYFRAMGRQRSVLGEFCT